MFGEGLAELSVREGSWGSGHWGEGKYRVSVQEGSAELSGRGRDQGNQEVGGVITLNYSFIFKLCKYCNIVKYWGS